MNDRTVRLDLVVTEEEFAVVKRLQSSAGFNRRPDLTRAIFLTGLVCYSHIDFVIPDELQLLLRPECFPPVPDDAA